MRWELLRSHLRWVFEIESAVLQLSLRDGGDRRYTRGSAYRIESPVFLRRHAALRGRRIHLHRRIGPASGVDAGAVPQKVTCSTDGDGGGRRIHTLFESDFLRLTEGHRS